MSTTALLAEFIIAGFIFFLALFFAILFVLGIGKEQLLNFLKELKEYETFATVSLIIISYFLGACLHRITTVKYYLELKNFISKKRETNPQEAPWRKIYYSVLTQGSDNLWERLDYLENLHRLLKNSAVGIFFLGLSLFFWLSFIKEWKIAWFSLIICLILSFFSATAAYSQYQNFRRSIKRAYTAITGEETEEGR